MLCYLCSVIIDKYKMAVKFDIHLVSDIPVWNGILTFVPPYMRVAADFMLIRPFTDFIGNKRQGSQVWFFFRFKDAIIPIFKSVLTALRDQSATPIK